MEDKTRIIAIVSDEFTDRLDLAGKLRQEGFSVETIRREDVSVDKLAAVSPNIIITDLDERNPADPFHLITRIKEDERLSGAEIFFCSGSIDVKTEIRLRKLRVSSYFIKTENIEHLVDAVSSHFVNLEAADNAGLEGQIQALDVPVGEMDSSANNENGAAGRFEDTDEFSSILGEFSSGVEKSLKGESDPFETLYNLGVSYYEMELFEKAIEELLKVSQSPEWRLKSLLMTGMAQRKMGAFEKSVETLKTGYREATDEFVKRGFLYELGDTLDVMGKPEEAYKMFAAVYQRDKEFRDVRARLINIKTSMESRNKA